MLKALIIFSTPYKPTKEVDFTDEIFGNPEAMDSFLCGTEILNYPEHYKEKPDPKVPLKPIFNMCYTEGEKKKFYSIGDWLEKIYYEKGGTEVQFNGDLVLLNEIDLEKLRVEVLLKRAYAYYVDNNPVIDRGIEVIESSLEEIREGNFIIAMYLY
jgi:hypothetical protein